MCKRAELLGRNLGRRWSISESFYVLGRDCPSMLYGSRSSLHPERQHTGRTPERTISYRTKRLLVQFFMTTEKVVEGANPREDKHAGPDML